MFGIRNAQDKKIPVAMEVLLVRDLGANTVSVGTLAEKGVKCDLLSTPPVLRHATNYFPISTEVPRMLIPTKAGYDPFPEPGRIFYQLGSTETKEEQEQKEGDGVGPAPQAQQQGLRRSGRQRRRMC